MGMEIDYILDELEDLQIDEIICTRDALQRKLKAIGQAENAGETDEVPSDECCEFLANYLRRLNERYQEMENQAYEYVELANDLVNAYMDEFKGMEISLSSLLLAAGKPSVQELGADTTLLLFAIDNVAQEAELYRHPITNPHDNSLHPDWATFTISYDPLYTKHTEEVYDFVIQDMIEKVEKELA